MSVSGVLAAVREFVRSVVTAVREFVDRVVYGRRRKREWSRERALHYLATVPRKHAPYVLVEHATPLVRPFPELDPEEAEWLAAGKAANLKVGVACIDGYVLSPGQRLSLWRHIGRPTLKRDFAVGPGMRDGRTVPALGGGLCQLSNLVYWMTLHTPMTVIERYRHPYDLFPDADRTQPFGTGATIQWPTHDLVIENTSQITFRLTVTLKKTELTGAWTSDTPVRVRYEVYEASHAMTQDPSGLWIRENEVRRRKFDEAGSLLGDELVLTNRARMMYEPAPDPEPEPEPQRPRLRLV